VTPPGPRVRAALVAGVIVLHFGIYRLVNVVNAGRPASAFLDLSTPVDGWLPYLGWTWVVYYATVPYVMVFGSLAVLRLPPRPAVRAVGTYVVMIVAGGALQLLFPARSPWPADVSPVQRFIHESVSYDPFVCLPSMHVALVTLTACLASAGSRTVRRRIGHGAVAVLVALSTLTLKEHYVWDVVAGGLLAAAGFTVWRHGTKAPPVAWTAHPSGARVGNGVES
jgi:membrane-associated phospholipid phosphatase